MKKIDLMIIGAQKAGTTSLNNYLNEHPSILGHPQTEFAYFRDDKIYEEGFDKNYIKYFTKGIDKKTSKVVAKNVGIYDNETALKRLHEHNPGCKIVFVVREPVSRAYSSYSMERFNGWLNKDFKEIENAIEHNNTSDVMYRLFVELGLYAKHLKNIYKYFPKEQVKIYLFEELNDNPIKLCKELYTWLDVDDNFMPDIEKKHNETRVEKSKLISRVLIKLRNNNNIIKKTAKIILPYSLFTRIGNYLLESNKSEKKASPLPEDTKRYLQTFFSSYNKELERLSGIKITEKWKYNASHTFA